MVFLGQYLLIFTIQVVFYYFARVSFIKLTSLVLLNSLIHWRLLLSLLAFRWLFSTKHVCV